LTAFTELILPERLKIIETYAFISCHELTEVTIPSTVTYLSGFYNCSTLKKVSIEEGCLETIGFIAFADCKSLESLVIPESVVSIEERAISGCAALKEVHFEGEAPDIVSDAFQDTTTIAYYPGDLDSWTEDKLQDYGGNLTWVSTHTHSYTSVITSPTCTEQGYTTYTCSSCGNSYKDTYVSALGHDYAEPEYISREEGHSYKCSRCGDVKIEACSFDEGTVLVEANPDQFGIKEHTCTLCGGSYKTEFVYRLYGDSRITTAIEVANKMKEVLSKESFDFILIANGDNFADALTGSYLASVKEAPILLYRAKGMELNEQYIQENLSEDGIVYILGGTAAVPAEVEESLKNAGYNVERLYGDSRFETNLKILEAAGVTNEEILICTGWNYADSLSASATGLPILMLNTVKNELTENQITFLEKYADNDFTIIGGTAAVSDELKANVESIVGEVDRIYGNGREATSVKVAERYFGKPDCVLIAYSRNFPDGLCGGPLAYAMKAPLLLVNANKEADAADYVAVNSIRKGIILGGTAAVSEDVVRVVFDIS
jgi:putative cell wall-binding protein